MDLESLALFVEVAHRGSFAAVARDRDVDPSSVSRSIALLEESLGLRLFQRTTRRMSLTESGERYLKRVEPLIEEFGRAGEEALAGSRAPGGTLRLTASVAFGNARLTPLLPAFRSRFPNLTLELILNDANLDLVAERIDLAVRLGPSITSDVIAAKLFETRYRVVASPSYLAAASSPLAIPDDLRCHDCLLMMLPEFRERWLFRDAAGITQTHVGGKILSSNPLTLRDAALAGLGPTLLPNWLIDEAIAKGQLVDLFPAYHVAATTFDTAAWLLYPSRSFLPHKVRVTIDFLREQLGAASNPSSAIPRLKGISPFP
jgi:DNA-binding transcriptional LysR family regulator